MSRQRNMEKILSSDYVTIGELVRLTGFRYSTLKFYTEEGMLPFVQKDKKLTRRYNREIAVEILEKIKQLKEQGLTVIEIKSNLSK